jgi:hypothetical protein
VSKFTISSLGFVLSVAAWSQQPVTTSPAPTPTPFAPRPTATASKVRVDAVNHVDAGQAYYRCYAVVPLIGGGTPADPKRPMFVPLAAAQTKDHSGIIGYQMQLSDDKTKALVEFVGRSRNDLLNIITEPTVTVFERGLASQAVIEAEFQKYKKGFTLNSWTPVRPQ